MRVVFELPVETVSKSSVGLEVCSARVGKRRAVLAGFTLPAMAALGCSAQLASAGQDSERQSAATSQRTDVPLRVALAN